MLNDETVQGSNFNCFHAGPMEGWAQFSLPHETGSTGRKGQGVSVGSVAVE
jgi:hypothetical protein